MFGSPSDPFGALLKHFRERQRLTQQQLAAALGIHRNTIGRWEEGSFLPKSKAMVRDLVRCLHLDEQETRQLLDASLCAPLPVWSVPYPRNPFFTGRAEALEALHTCLAPDRHIGQSYALHGLGGVGKTQLALEYAYQYTLEYSAIFWIEAETVEQIRASLLRIATRLDLPEHAETDQQIIVAVQRWLETHDEWLLIWDNLEDLDLLPRFLPAAQRGVILITTRRQALRTRAQGIDLAPQKEEEAILFLLRRAKMLDPLASNEIARHPAVQMSIDYAAASDLVALLGGLPLALDQAGAYIDETGCGVTDYLRHYQQHYLHLLDRRGASGADHPHSVATTFWLACEQARREQIIAADLLYMCAFLYAEAIPEELFEVGAAHLGPELSSLEADPLCFDRAVAVLRNLSLIQCQPKARLLSVHRLVQTVLRGRMSEPERALWRGRVLAALNAAFPKVTPETSEQCERLLPHVQACVATFLDQTEDQTLAEVVQKAADYLRARAHYTQAEPL